MARFTPPRRLREGRLALFCAFAAAFVCFCFGFGARTPGGVALNCLGITVAGTAILLCARGFFTEYTYVAEESDVPGEYDFTVIASLGKRSRTVCRVSLRGCAVSKTRARGKKIYGYYPFFCGLDRYYLDSPEAAGEYLIAIAADAAFVSTLEAAGAEIRRSAGSE